MAVHQMIRHCFILLTVVACCSSHCSPRQKKTPPRRTLPDDAGFPSDQQFLDLAADINGTTLTPNDAVYDNASFMYNLRVHQDPFRIYDVSSVEDVQKIILFAKRHNLRLSVRSSGHSFIGRSTNEDGVVISLAKLKGRSFNLNSARNPAGEATVQSGNTWLEVYKAVDALVTTDAQNNPQRRVIVGGSAHTVAMGGYTQGGGHSPISRKLGLAVDNLLEATIVLADGRKAVANENGTTITDLRGRSTRTDDASLFWAIRGGGGGTWGVVIDFTFKLHYAPERFRVVGISWALYYQGSDIGTDMMKFVMKELAGLSPDWGGYMLVGMPELGNQAMGYLTLFLNHFGSNDSASNADVNALLNYNPIQAQYSKYEKYYNTFMEYELNAQDPSKTNAYIFNSFIEFPADVSLNDERLQNLTAFMMNMRYHPTATGGYSCTGVMIGGNTNQVATGVTPVNPKFRSGLLSLTCALSWSDLKERDDFYIKHALIARDELAKLGDGVYYNEPAEDLDDWKVQFWGNGSNYQRLLEAKKKWDPDHFFWCHNCVGSDLGAGMKSGYSDPDDEGDDDSTDNAEVKASSVQLSSTWVSWCLALLMLMVFK